jgi:hypothetical protein
LKASNLKPVEALRYVKWKRFLRTNKLLKQNL